MNAGALRSCPRTARLELGLAEVQTIDHDMMDSRSTSAASGRVATAPTDPLVSSLTFLWVLPSILSLGDDGPERADGTPSG